MAASVENRHANHSPLAKPPNFAISLQSARRQLKMLRQDFRAGQIGKPGHLGLESEFDGSCRAVPLLADYDFGLAMRLFHVGLPSGELLASLARQSPQELGKLS
jgi:hypothetical protein